MLDLRYALSKLSSPNCPGISELTVGIYGLGRTGMAILPLLDRVGVKGIIVRDGRTDVEIPKTATPLFTYFGDRCDCDIYEDILILSPSVRRDRTPLLSAALRGTQLTSECELFFSSKPRAVGITGSDGKSTTTALTERLLCAAGYSAAAVGNIGVPYSSVPKKDIYVAELSSFNLSYITPTLISAAITNITPNHLNWHKAYGEYKAAKLNILANAERSVLSYDDPECRRIILSRGADTVFSTRSGFRELSSTGLADTYLTLEGGYICKNGTEISDTRAYIKREEHTLANMLTAIGLTSGMLPDSVIDRAFKTFSGLPNRCELVGRALGVDFFGSSIDTTPRRTARTLNSLGRRVKLLLGGRGKGLPYEPLIEPLSKYAVELALYGDERAGLLEFIKGCSLLSDIPVSSHESFDEAFTALVYSSSACDTLLLSPAMTAYGEFSDYEERGRRFRELVNLLKCNGKI